MTAALAVDKLPLDIKKHIKNFMLLSAIKKNDAIHELQRITSIIIERVQNLNFLKLYFNEHMFW